MNVYPSWRSHDVKNFIAMTLPPGADVPTFFDGLLFIDALGLAIALREEGKLLLEALKEKWPEAVENQIHEATKLAEKSHKSVKERMKQYP